MRQKKIFLILALLCAMVQGTRAQNFDVWDGVTTKKPSGYYDYDFNVTINSAAELAYVMQNYKPDNQTYIVKLNEQVYKVRL
ncbi:MAG: hypothetical protein II886_02655 [Prevotella sp.]|nr:hypothetical protein [Prevotella sp.]